MTLFPAVAVIGARQCGKWSLRSWKLISVNECCIRVKTVPGEPEHAVDRD